MITQFKIYESYGYNGKFFFKPTTNQDIHGNLCFVLNYDYYGITTIKMKVINIKYDKGTLVPWISSENYWLPSDGKRWLREESLEYSSKTVDRLEFFTAEELYQNYEKLTTNIYKILSQIEVLRKDPIYKKIKDEFLQSSSLKMREDTKKYNL